MVKCIVTSHVGQACRFSKIGEKVVEHQARKYGVTKFGLERFVNGFLDLMTVTFYLGLVKNQCTFLVF